MESVIIDLSITRWRSIDCTSGVVVTSFEDGGLEDTSGERRDQRRRVPTDCP
jgi:hypothetical protein